jgi:phosphatidylinositol alpha-1,6-mannosyltransferase
MRVLFIARRFPPSVGGMERFAYSLSESLPDKDTELVKITWSGSSRLTLFFAIPWLFLKGLWTLWTDRSIELIHMQDAVLSPPGWLLSKLSRRPWMVVAHGLDLTFKLQFYQNVTIFFAKRAGAMVAISEATAHEARIRGIQPNKLSIIPLGVDDEPKRPEDRGEILKAAGLTSTDQVLLTVGRLTKRKGVAWFITHVLPELPPKVHYVVIGDGAQRPAIEAAIHKVGLDDRVHMLGAVSDTVKQQWLATADIFVMPNIMVPGDMEGFGIVAHEAAMAELPVVASDLEGITQAIQDSKNGLLLKPGDAQAYKTTLARLLGNSAKRQSLGKQARRYTKETFGWSTIAKQYRAIYNKLIS